MRVYRYFFLIIILLILSVHTQAQKDTLKAAHIDTPAVKPPDTPKIIKLPLAMKHEPKREFRGMWIATVANIDWPSSPGLPVEKQKSELITLLDMAHAAGLNAVMLQVRPAADAFYLKSVEPWSRWLTGKQGVAPDPSYDPLEFAILEAHKRGMELHAWFNPYRATFDSNFRSLSPSHITNQVPQWFFTYGGIKLFNPGIPDVRDYIVKVIMHVVDNYNIDGVHMDDYFYPYSIPGQHINDAQTFKDYGGGFTDINDWRRNNVDLLIQALNDSIHAHKPWIKFGIAPFGIWKNARQDPEGSETSGGDSYYELYADTRKWLQEGWIDYVAPQLYWNFGYRYASFDKILDWWSNNTYGRHLYVGQGVYRAFEPRSYAFHKATELPNQIRYLRNNNRVQGSIFFSANSLMKDPHGFTDSLHQDFYKYPALPPVMDWLDSIGPNAPKNLAATVNVKSITLNWQTPDLAEDKEAVYGYVIYRFNVTDTVDLDNPKYILHIQYNPDTTYTDDTVERNKHYIYVVTALDRMKNESDPSPEVNVTAN